MLKQLLVTLLLVLLFFLPGAFAQKSVEPATEFSKVSREVKNMLEAQIALARLGISPGVLDGLDGRQTSRAIATFQKKYDLKVTGKMDSATCRVLHIYEPVFIEYTVSHSDKESLTKNKLTLSSGVASIND
jgi:peptidoglycan hydrolase-like protein with peptidoglycan-binding domain